jgi:hypothetical protein
MDGNLLKIAALTSVLIVSTACIRHADVNTNCQWTGEGDARPLDLSRAEHMRHLNDDALFAEDLAIRFADVHRGHRSGHFQGNEAYRGAREQCMARLFEGVAADHQVAVTQVRAALEYRSMRYEASVVLSFLLLFVFVSSRITRQIVSALPPSKPWFAAFALFVLAVPLGGVAVLSANLWSGLAQMIRLGNDHISYRVGRALLPRYQLEVFLACAVVFWMTSAVRYRLRPEYSDQPPARLGS